MKFVTKLLLLTLSLQAYGAPIRIYYEQDSGRADTVKQILTRDYQIPEDLIHMKQITNCEGLSEKGKLDLCLNNNGDLLVVSVDSGFVKESLKIFRAP